MQTWALSFSPTFLNELLDVPRAISKQVSKKTKVLETDPYSAQGDAKKLKGYTNDVYRVRLGDYRLFYVIGAAWVKLLSIRKRDGAYDSDDLSAFFVPDAPPAEAELMPQPIGVPAAVPLPTGATPAARPLPFALTEARLQQWHIPTDCWAALLQVHDEDALLSLTLPGGVLERLIDNLFPRTSLAEIDAQPELVLRASDDLDRFVEGDLTAFLLKLDPEQQRLCGFGSGGPTLVKGGPGTGKSTLALYRVQRLRDAGCSSILFTTYTNALVKYSEQLLEHLLGQPPAACGVKVSTVDSLATHHYARKYGRPKIDTDNAAAACAAEALETAAIPAQNDFDRTAQQQTLERLGAVYLLDEFLQVIEDWGVATLEEYQAVERRGRGTPLKPATREAIWSVYQTWRSLLEQRGGVTWQQVRLGALEHAASLPDKPYEAVIIDEAQDLSPVALRFLLALCTSSQGIYLTADALQSIYQRGFSWKQVHSDLNVRGRTLVLRRNYRNTSQIMQACSTILHRTAGADTETLYPDPSPYTGEVPTILLTDDEAQEAAAVHAFLTRAARRFRLPIHGGAVLCPSNRIAKKLAYALEHLGMRAEHLSGKQVDLRQPCVKVLTLQAAKGLEFPFVAVVGLRAGTLPHTPDPALPAEEAALAEEEQRRLFFVACSRAMRALLVCGSAEQPSPFLDALHAPAWQPGPGNNPAR